MNDNQGCDDALVRGGPPSATTSLEVHMFCMGCGARNEMDDHFCGACGISLRDAASVCTACGSTIDPDGHFCSTCGAPHDTAAAFVPGPARTASATVPAPTINPTITSPAVVSAPAAPTRAAAIRPISVAAAAVALVGAFLSWFDAFGTTTNSFDIAVHFLIDNQTTASDTFTIGALVAILAGAAGLSAVVPSIARSPMIIRALGIGLIAVAALFAIQIARTASDLGVSVTDLMGVGPFLAGGAGLALLAGK